MKTRNVFRRSFYCRVTTSECSAVPLDSSLDALEQAEVPVFRAQRTVMRRVSSSPQRPVHGAFFKRNSSQNSKLSTMTQYKMILSIENSICDDYVSEKIYVPLLHGAVPVYLGAPNVAEHIPDKDAIINLHDFADAKAAGAYLQSMLADPAAFYQKHHSWRTRPYTGSFASLLASSYRGKNFFCNLCRLYWKGRWKTRRGDRDADGARHRSPAPMRKCLDNRDDSKWPYI